MAKYASVILENFIQKPLDYKIPDSLAENIKEGVLVEVPLRNKLRKGLVLSLKDKTKIPKTLEICRVVTEDIISKDIFSLALWMSKYYCCSLSKVLTSIIPKSLRDETEIKYQIIISTNKSKKELLEILNNLINKFPKQAKTIEYFLKYKKQVFLKDFMSETNLSKAPIDTLIKKKILFSKKIFSDELDILNSFEYFQTKNKKLNIDQQKAYNKIENTLKNDQFQTHLIYGVTGSGKTEIYMQAIEKALQLNKSSIMIVPEISLTTQTIERFKARFKEKIAIYHHKRSSSEKIKAWKDLLKGDIKIVIGARSSIFCPIKNLGLIIIDEEHDPSYKQNSKIPPYNTKHLAIMRAKYTNSCVVLASATPSIESYFSAISKKYDLSVLPNRSNDAKLANVQIIDMKQEAQKSKSYFSNQLLLAIKDRYEKGEQTLLFINRRGYHTSIICSNCNETIKCDHCDISLTYHKKDNIISCHLCGKKVQKLNNCPNCNHKDYIKYKGYGTEHIQNSLRAIFPNIRSIRIDRDTTTTKDSLENSFKQFRAGKADILTGTQMIVKGLHYPSVTLVGILNTDGALNIPDFRSSERVFQLITQACGRAGRDKLKGDVIIQTYLKDNETIKFGSKQDFLGFYEHEIKNRKLFNYPPFCQMAKISFLSKNEKRSENIAQDFRKKLINNISSNFIIHPVLPSGRVKVKDIYKYQFLVRGKNILPLCKVLNEIRNDYLNDRDVFVFIDIDPIDTFF